MLKVRYYPILSLLTIGLLSGCLNREKLLKQDQYLLYSQTIKGNKKMPEGELTPFYRQTANRRLFGLPVMPYLWIYAQGAKRYDRQKVERKIEATTQKYDTRIAAAEEAKQANRLRRLKRQKDRRLDALEKNLEEGNFLMRFGEPPVAFDSSLAKQTADQMRAYLARKGFFNGQATFRYDLNAKRRTASVTYLITENTPYRVLDTTLVTDNRAIDSLLRSNLNDASLKPGSQYDVDKLDAERERIDRLLKNNGYYNFSRQYVEFEVDSTVRDTSIVDTTQASHRVDLYTLINKPGAQEQHKQYRIDEVYFVEDADNRSRRSQRDTTVFAGIHYLARQPRYSRRIMDTKLLIRPGDLYSLQNTLETQRLLTSMDIFKFANIYYDTTGGKFTARIFTNPIEKYSYTAEGGGTVTMGYPGPFGSLNFKIRNVFNGMEIFEVRATGGIEGQAAVSDINKVYGSQELNITSSLTFPQILFPSKARFRLNRYTPSTRITAGYNLTVRPEFRRFNFRGSFAYNWQPSPKHSYNVTLLDVSRIYSTFTDRDFQILVDTTLREQGSSLWRSFRRSFVTSASASYTFNGSVGTPGGRTHYLRLFLENGGSYLNFLGLQGDSLRNGLQFYRFVRFSSDFRYYLPTGKGKTWAFRVNLGIANPYGPSRSLPYEKFFFAGGSNSVRAWAPRRLGFGSVPDSLSADRGLPSYDYEQPGDILIEGSAEYRFDIISFLEGAVFVDAGNTWQLYSSEASPGGNFKFNRFYKEFGVGGGIGARLDFSFLIVRLDLATKLYDPGRLGQDRWAFRKLTAKNPFGEKRQTVLNLGIGYPF